MASYTHTAIIAGDSREAHEDTRPGSSTASANAKLIPLVRLLARQAAKEASVNNGGSHDD